MQNQICFLLAIIGLWCLGCASAAKSIKADAPSLSVYQFEQLDSLQRKEPRPVAVFLHAEWCKFCRNMEQTTFKRQSVVELLNEQYYFISFDGEQREDIFFQNHTFRYQPNGRSTGIHELAIELGKVGNELAFPTFVLLNTDYEIVFQQSAFMSHRQMEKVLRVGK